MAGKRAKPGQERVRRAFGAALRHYRERAGLSQDQLAELASSAQNVISHIEAGTKGVTLSKFYEYAAALGMTPQDLLAAVDAELTRRSE